MADLFRERLEASKDHLLKAKPAQFEVPADRCFIGFDAYEKVIACEFCPRDTGANRLLHRQHGDLGRADELEAFLGAGKVRLERRTSGQARPRWTLPRAAAGAGRTQALAHVML